MQKVLTLIIIALLFFSLFISNSEKLKHSIFIGFLFSIPFGVGLWFGKQAKKSETLLPIGKITKTYGYVIGSIICLFSFLSISFYISKLEWFLIISYLSLFILSIPITIIIERLLYCKSWMIDRLEVHAERFIVKYEDDAPFLWEKAVPRWWLNMMSKKWENEYRMRVGKIIFTLNPADPLFSMSEFQKRFEEFHKKKIP